MESLRLIIDIVQWVLIITSGFSVIYILTFAIAGNFRKRIILPKSTNFRKFLVLIPCYKEDVVIIDVAKEALNQNYPKDFYEVIVIADKLKSQTIAKLREMVQVVEVSFETSSKSKSINYVLKELNNVYDAIMILDADNIMDPNVLSLMNQMMEKGAVAVQGHRTAKNLNTPFAILDAISEEINNHIFRKGHRALGLSSALIGSGMAFDYRLYKKYMDTIESFGEDKELENKMLRDRIVFEYLEDALIYDEKVSKSEVFVNQRARWIFNQYNYAKGNFVDGLKQLILKKNIDYFDKIIQHFLPPRIFLLGVVYLLLLFNLFLQDLVFLPIWSVIALLCSIALIISVPKSHWNFRTLKSVLYLPIGLFLMTTSLFHLNKAKKRFVHTEHSFTETKENK